MPSSWTTELEEQNRQTLDYWKRMIDWIDQKDTGASFVELIQDENGDSVYKIKWAKRLFTLIDNENGNMINFKKDSNKEVTVNFYGGLGYPDRKLCNYRCTGYWVNISEHVGTFGMQMQQILEYLDLTNSFENAQLIMDTTGIECEGIDEDSYQDYCWDEGEGQGKLI